MCISPTGTLRVSLGPKRWRISWAGRAHLGPLGLFGSTVGLGPGPFGPARVLWVHCWAGPRPIWILCGHNYR